MTDAVDHFAALGIVRAPWVDSEALKARFHSLSAQQHPDAGGSADAFTRLNAAWQALREPAGCLKHFLELEHPDVLATASAAQAPAELAGLFMDIAAFRQASQTFAAKFAAASSPLTKALLEPERIALRAKLDLLAVELTNRTARISSTLRDNSATPQQLASALASLVFLSKWSALLAELRLGL